MTERICSAPDCEARVRAKGLCGAHYMRQLRHGSLESRRGHKLSRGRKHTPETKAKISAALTGRSLAPEHKAKNGELNANWQGDGVSYSAAHLRHKKVLPNVCALVDETCKGELQSAFKHETPPEFVKIDARGFPYSTRSEDYLRLCKSHHYRYDNAEVAS